MEVVEYSSGIVLFPNSDGDNSGWWMEEIKKKCDEMGKPIIVIE